MAETTVTVTKYGTVGGIPILKANLMGEWGICMAVYGKPGVGKTTFAADAEDSEFGSPVLMIDAEGGARAVSHREIDVVSVKTWMELDKVTKALQHGCPYKTVIVDNMSEVQSLSIRSIASNNMPQIQDWGKSTADLLALTRTYRDIAQHQSVNVVLIAWETLEKDEGETVIRRDLGFTPSLARQFPGIVDIVGHMTVMNNGMRVISFAPSNRTAAKFRRSKSERANKVPLVIQFGADDKPIVDLLDVLRGGKEWPTAKYLRKSEGETK